MSELALKLIEENKKTRSPFLDLGNCGLTEVPEEIGELAWLEELSFASEYRSFSNNELRETKNKGLINKLKTLNSTNGEFGIMSLFGKRINTNPFINLINLKELYINGNAINLMSFNNLSPLTCLSNLQSLNISFTRVLDLSPLSSLYNLKHLNICFTKVTTLQPLSNLSNLRELIAYHIKIDNLNSLSNLFNLEILDVSQTNVTDLSPLSNLIYMEELYVEKSRVKNLSPISKLINKKFLICLKLRYQIFFL